MIIVLKGANFSTKNLGRITIPSANLVSLEIRGESSVEGVTGHYTCYGTYDDNSVVNVTDLVTWGLAGANDSQYASISNGTLIVSSNAITEQDVTLSASLDGKSTTKVVSVLYSEDIDTFTRNVFSYYGNDLRSFTGEQRLAIDTFFTEVNDASWHSKIKLMIMPILHKNTSAFETLSDLNASKIAYDVISGSAKTVSLGTNNVYGSQYGELKIGDYGIQKALDGVTFHQNFNPLIWITSLGISSFNGFALAYIKNDGSVKPTTLQPLDGINPGFFYTGGGRAYLGATLHTTDRQKYVSADEGIGVTFGLNRTDENTFSGYINGSHTPTKESGSAGTLQKIGLGNINVRSEGCLGFTAVGEGMSAADFEEFAGMVKTLMDTLANQNTQSNESNE